MKNKKTKKILLIDHIPETVDVIKEILYHDIFDITVAGDSVTAKKLLAKHEFHLAITETLLPKSHGFVLARYISENYPNIKIIIIGEKIKKLDSKREAQRHGACEFLQKPLDIIKFTKKIFKHLGIKEKRNTVEFHNETTNINLIPLLADLKAQKEKKSEKDTFDDIIRELKIKEDTHPYEIELDW